MTPTERAKAHRQKRIAEGWKVVHVQIPPDAVRCMEQAMSAKNLSKRQIVTMALLELCIQT